MARWNLDESWLKFSIERAKLTLSILLMISLMLSSASFKRQARSSFVFLIFWLAVSIIAIKKLKCWQINEWVAREVYRKVTWLTVKTRKWSRPKHNTSETTYSIFYWFRYSSNDRVAGPLSNDMQYIQRCKLISNKILIRLNKKVNVTHPHIVTKMPKISK